jgi:sulfite reductase (ferredoxin)
MTQASHPEGPTVKETKTQRTERLKREQNPWVAFDEIRRFAAEGRGSVLPEWTSLYFKWWGIYTQGDGVGAVGGVGGEGKSSDYFMLRIPVATGILSSVQAATIADIARSYGRNLADITVRQAIQLHWLPIESIPEIIERLGAVGLSPRGACGDVVRNVTGCPLAGLAEDEVFDASPVARSVARALAGNAEFYNLPRKFKISVTGCGSWCSHPEINDIGLSPARHGTEVGFSVRVGGGLSKEPHLAVRLDAFVRPEQTVEVVTAITTIFREQQGLRENRDRARLKHLFLKEGWTAESFLAELQLRLPFRLDPAAKEDIPADVVRDHVGIHRQRQADLYYVGASVLRGRLTGDQLAAAAELAERYGSGELRTTVMQNLLFVNVPRRNVEALVAGLAAIDLRVDGSHFWRGAVACTGTEFCKLAITETKGFTRWLVDEMETRLPEFDQQLRLHVTGCPNGCGQHWIADVGIEGKKIKHNGTMVDAYYFCVGGSVGASSAIARPVGYRCPATLVPDSLERLLRGYLASRWESESLRSFLSRHSNDHLRALLAGEVAEAVERDQPTGRVPVGVGE